MVDFAKTHLIAPARWWRCQASRNERKKSCLKIENLSATKTLFRKNRLDAIVFVPCHHMSDNDIEIPRMGTLNWKKWKNVWRRLALNFLVRASSALLLSAQRFAFFSIFSIPVLSTHYIPLFNWRKKSWTLRDSIKNGCNQLWKLCVWREKTSVDCVWWLNFELLSTKSNKIGILLSPFGGNLTTEFSPLTMRRNRKFDGNSIPNNEQMSIVAFGGDSCSFLSPHSQFIKL